MSVPFHDAQTLLPLTIDALDEIGLQLDNEKLDKLRIYYDMLIDWNQRMNLTALVEPVDVAQKHFADSLLALKFGLLPVNASVIDVGTGAGFPGVVLAIARPDIKLTLLDSLRKRIGFLSELCGELGITAELIHSRAEDAGNDAKLRGKFDCAVSRAVAPSAVLVELIMPFVAKGKTAICYKGGTGGEEFKNSAGALKRLCAELQDVHEVECSWGKRSIVVLRQNGIVPKQYPRKAGTPARDPLK